MIENSRVVEFQPPTEPFLGSDPIVAIVGMFKSAQKSEKH